MTNVLNRELIKADFIWTLHKLELIQNPMHLTMWRKINRTEMMKRGF